MSSSSPSDPRRAVNNLKESELTPWSRSYKQAVIDQAIAIEALNDNKMSKIRHRVVNGKPTLIQSC